VHVFQIHQLEAALAQVERHLLLVLDVRQDLPVALHDFAHAGVLARELLIALDRVRLAHRLGGAGVRDHDRREAKTRNPVRMIVVRLGMDDEAHRLGRELLEDSHCGQRIHRGLSGIDHHHAFFGLDDADVESCAFAA